MDITLLKENTFFGIKAKFLRHFREFLLIRESDGFLLPSFAAKTLQSHREEILSVVNQINLNSDPVINRVYLYTHHLSQRIFRIFSIRLIAAIICSSGGETNFVLYLCVNLGLNSLPSKKFRNLRQT